MKLSLNFVDSSSADNQRLIEAVVQLCCRTGPSMLRYFNLSLEPVNQMTHQMTKNAKSTVSSNRLSRLKQSTERITERPRSLNV